jgi:hypothetical protein
MDWSALLGGLIGAGIPAWLAFLALRRGRQSADAEAFGPAVLLLDRVHPARVTMNASADREAEAAKWAELRGQLDVARARLLIVSAGNPRRNVRELARTAEVKLTTAFEASGWAVHDLILNRDNPELVTRAEQAHAEAESAMRNLIAANFAWGLSWRRSSDDQGGLRRHLSKLRSQPGPGVTDNRQDSNPDSQQ